MYGSGFVENHSRNALSIAELFARLGSHALSLVYGCIVASYSNPIAQHRYFWGRHSKGEHSVDFIGDQFVCGVEFGGAFSASSVKS